MEKIIPPEQLREYRERAGLTQTDLAEKIGVKQAHISYVENGRKDVTYSKLKRMTDIILSEIEKKEKRTGG